MSYGLEGEGWSEVVRAEQAAERPNREGRHRESVTVAWGGRRLLSRWLPIPWPLIWTRRQGRVLAGEIERALKSTNRQHGQHGWEPADPFLGEGVQVQAVSSTRQASEPVAVALVIDGRRLVLRMTRRTIRSASSTHYRRVDGGLRAAAPLTEWIREFVDEIQNSDAPVPTEPLTI